MCHSCKTCLSYPSSLNC
ncbi:hypothetical protein FBD94_04575 [Pedobacter hiemivivus]|uniref:Uncharacterized protein n=1 Tax=Pedobacter hiemivivus TaxID=2530454 RepID=A0A4V5PGQ2_9SPHI|nr:hypothetical protein FBD94_04575 [Pedobacter hiemivivus]